MKISPTMMGGLRIDAEGDADWHLLNMIIIDAASCDRGLAERLADAIGDGEMADDWSEWVVPELAERFEGELAYVKKVVDTARSEAPSGVASLWVKPSDAQRWYGALNQARLALEARHHFGPGEGVDLEKLALEKRGAFMRSQFYCALQSALLDHAMQ